MDTKITVAIIGAGISGLAAAKESLACGLEPTVFEATAGWGGLWNQTTEQGSVWNSMQTNKDMFGYITSYVEANHLASYIRFSCRITSATQADQSNGKWTISWTNTIADGSKTESAVFDKLIVATGGFSKPQWPKLPGIENFKGQQLHGRLYRSPEDFKGKRVAIIGNAYSGAEIACDLVGHAEYILDVGHRNFWIIPRMLKLPAPAPVTPIDLHTFTRARNSMSKGVPLEILNPKKSEFFEQFTNQNKIQGLEISAEDRSKAPFVIISDSFVDHVENKRIEYRTDELTSVKESSVVFADGSERQVDVILYASGYSVDLDFFDTSVKEHLSYKSNDQYIPILLHKYVFPPSVTNLAFTGVFRGPFFGLVELQARWATLVLSGAIPAPTASEIQSGVEAQSLIRQSPRQQFPYPDYINFSDDLAAQIGVLPNFEQLKVSDPELHSLVWDFVISPASYRLFGPHANPEVARARLQEIKDSWSVKSNN
eukprot:gene16948-20161_t